MKLSNVTTILSAFSLSTADLSAQKTSATESPNQTRESLLGIVDLPSIEQNNYEKGLKKIAEKHQAEERIKEDLIEQRKEKKIQDALAKAADIKAILEKEALSALTEKEKKAVIDLVNSCNEKIVEYAKEQQFSAAYLQTKCWRVQVKIGKTKTIHTFHTTYKWQEQDPETKKIILVDNFVTSWAGGSANSTKTQNTSVKALEIDITNTIQANVASLRKEGVKKNPSKVQTAITEPK